MGYCIYCDSKSELTDEHIIPHGLGGKLILKDSSCKTCAIETSRLEDALLRGHWASARKHLNMPSRHKRRNEGNPTMAEIKIIRRNGIILLAQIRADEANFLLLPYLFRSELLHEPILEGIKPYAKNFGFIFLKINGPSKAYISGNEYKFDGSEKIENIINKFDSNNIFRFLAKIAHSYAIHIYGLSACNEYYLPKIILGNVTEAMQYIGNAPDEMQNLRLDKCDDFHSLKSEILDGHLCVYIQLFNVTNFTPTPIYQVVVGRVNAQGD